jgi:ribose 5-phosphate isomerase B
VKIAIGADHRGYKFKAKVIAILESWGHEVSDMGTHSEESCDYPDFGIKVGEAVVAGLVDYGINICWTGNGMAIASNKVKGVRAGLALSPDMAELTRLHNDANVLILPEKYLPPDQLEATLKAFLETGFEGGRHIARVEKIKAAEC